MELDHLWLAEYLESEISRLKKVEGNARTSLATAKGDVAKFDSLIAMETARDAEYQRSKRIAEKVVDHNQIALDNVSPRLDKLTEQWAILNSLPTPSMKVD